MVVDGLGFEEVNQAVTSTETISGTNVYGISGTFARDTITVADIVTANITTTSGGNIRGTNIITPGSFTDSLGKLQSVSLGSATTTVYGGIIQTGSGVTSAGSIGYVKLGVPTSTATYYVGLTPRTFTAGAGSVVPFTSGTYSTSGVSFIGAAAANYDWIVISA